MSEPEREQEVGGAEPDARVRHAIYRHFARTGAAPGAAALAGAVRLDVAAVEASLERLAAAHAIVLAPGTTNIWMAHPFSAVPTPFPVQTAARRYWANCAWDALGVAALLGEEAEVATSCGDCGERLVLRVRGGRAEPADAVVHFLVPPRRFWASIGFT